MVDTAPTSTTDRPGSPSRDIWNVPNQLTIARLILAVICFGFVIAGWYRTSLVLFVVAAGTDWLDGYWARRFNQVTQLGRILDPFADKFIICGIFIFLAAAPNSQIAAWMAVVVMGREMLVTALRSFLEERDVDFSASRAGKWKMVLQCLAAGLSLYRLSYFDVAAQPPAWLTYILVGTVWSAIALTAYSGWLYVAKALKLLETP